MKILTNKIRSSILASIISIVAIGGIYGAELELFHQSEPEVEECEQETFFWPIEGKDPFGYDSATNGHSRYWVADCWCIFNGWDNYQQAILDKTSSPSGWYATIDDPGGTPAVLVLNGSYAPYKAITCKRNC